MSTHSFVILPEEFLVKCRAPLVLVSHHQVLVNYHLMPRGEKASQKTLAFDLRQEYFRVNRILHGHVAADLYFLEGWASLVGIPWESFLLKREPFTRLAARIRAARRPSPPAPVAAN